MNSGTWGVKYENNTCFNYSEIISLTVRHLHDGDDESGHEVPDEVLGPVVPRKPGEHRKDIVRQMGHALLKS